jgi:hypothetical protein
MGNLLLETVVIGRDVPDIHAPANFAPEVRIPEPLQLAHGPSSEAGVPADRLVEVVPLRIQPPDLVTSWTEAGSRSPKPPPWTRRSPGNREAEGLH